jgi:hypothetical protein
MEIPKFSPFDVLVTALVLVLRDTNFGADDDELDLCIKLVELKMYVPRGMSLPPEDMALAKAIANKVARAEAEDGKNMGDTVAASASELTNEQVVDVLSDFHDRIKKIEANE